MTILCVIVGGLLLAGVAIAIIVRSISARCPRCGSHHVFEDSDDPQVMRCLDCGATWRE
jgi:uncharacterized protein (DUF983 family)